MLKSLSELALNISEQDYRDIDCLSYSAIAKYEKGGFAAISHLYDKQESDALTFGSVVDTLITEGQEKFNDKFVVANFTLPTDSIKNIVDILLNNNSEETIDEISDDTILRVCNECEYNFRLKDDTRIAKVRNEGAQYYNTTKKAVGKEIISHEVYDDAISTVMALRNHPLISKYLGTTDGDTEFLYQLKFKTNLDGLEVKFMPDLLIVMHASKTIIPVDLKTSSFPEYDFPKRYLENRYDIQSRLYYRALNKVLSEDDYFKDFKLGTFKFIVVNKSTLNPLSFRDEKCMVNGDIVLEFKSGRKTILRDPITIGKELQEYLDNPTNVPIGIENNQSNNIYERIKLL
jgi:hypothetical protein